MQIRGRIFIFFYVFVATLRYVYKRAR